ncbi:hypothetical protein [Nafulsella turpanensis]|uniref:hypothetical protein n=1 Tax=Nafulsella turpanensis TaxID=1265690 RepID=UPI00034658BC|nr:hypothetical protein [Nafulsella turpanensis]
MKLHTILLMGLMLMLGPWSLADEFNNIAVSGTIENPEVEEVRIVLYNFVPGQNNLSSVAALKNDNSFSFVSYLREPVFGHISHGNSKVPIYLEPGYDLRLSFDAAAPEESLRFSGIGAENNQFLARRSQFIPAEEVLMEQLRKLDIAAFIDWAGEQRQAQLALLEEYRDSLSSDFVALQEADIAYNWANQLFRLGQFAEGRRQNLPEDFHLFMDEVKLHNYDMIVLQSYREFLENYLQYNYRLMKAQLPDEKNSYYGNMYKVARQSLRSLPSYHMQAKYLVKALEHLGIEKVTDEYIEFANECPVQSYKNVLHQMVKEQTISPKEPEIVFTDEEGRSIPLTELTGRIVLVRFINHMSDSVSKLLREHDQALKERLTSYKEVQFLQLPMETNREAYEKMVYADASEYLKSIMNRPKPGQEKPKSPAFSYILLNRNGLVVSNSLDDPRNELAIEKIDALLRQEKLNTAAVE